jgi:N-acetylmuramoyl-L-alanine amidase CwlA
MTYAAPSPEYAGPSARHSGTGNKPIKRIVMHGTVSPCVPGGAQNIARYFRSSSARGSAHYVIDPVEVLQTAFDSVIAWHAPPNFNSLGIELCDMVGDSKGALPLSRWDDKNHAAMLKLAARLVAELCLAYDVPPTMLGPKDLKAGKRGICEHSDVSEAFGQSTHWDLGLFPRLRFQSMVRAEIADIKAGTKTEHKPTRIDRARDLLEAAKKRGKVGRQMKIQAALDCLPHH